MPINSGRHKFMVMYCGTIAPWEHYPKSLRFNEVQNPLKVIIDFFSAARPKDHHRQLKEWRHFVVNEQHFNDERHGPGTLLFVHDMNIKLIEATHLLLGAYKDDRNRLKKISAAAMASEKREWPYFPKNLSENELINPYKAIKKCFKKIKPQEYRIYLHEWLHCALNNHAADETLGAGEIITVYENMRRLYSAAWLIHQRDTGETITYSGKIKYRVQPDIPAPLKKLNGELTPAELPGLNEVQEMILKKVPSVQLIACIGRHESPFTYYLVILIDEREKMPEHEISNKIEDNCRYLVNLCTIVHKTSSAIKGIKEGQRFLSSVFSNGSMVYAAPGLELPQVSEIGKEVLLERADFHWQRWGIQGKEFLVGAQRYCADGNYRLASFLLHQSVESILKSVIQVVIGYRIQMHNLLRLLHLSLLFTDALHNVFELDNKEGNRVFNLLRGSYSDSRYKNEFEADKEPIEYLIIKARLLFETAEQVYRQYIDNIK